MAPPGYIGVIWGWGFVMQRCVEINLGHMGFMWGGSGLKGL